MGANDVAEVPALVGGLVVSVDEPVQRPAGIRTPTSRCSPHGPPSLRSTPFRYRQDPYGLPQALRSTHAALRSGAPSRHAPEPPGKRPRPPCGRRRGAPPKVPPDHHSQRWLSAATDQGAAGGVAGGRSGDCSRAAVGGEPARLAAGAGRRRSIMTPAGCAAPSRGMVGANTSSAGRRAELDCSGHD